MKRLHLLGAALCATTAFSLAQAASAATWTTTYTGVVTSGSDIGSFGIGCVACLDGDISGFAFTATFITNSATPGATVTPGPNSLLVSGSTPASPVSASITINGQTLFLGGDSGSQFLSDDGVEQKASHSARTFFSSYFQDEEGGLFGSTIDDFLSLQVTGLGDGNLNTLPPGVIGTGSLSQFRDFASGFIGVSANSGADLAITSVATSFVGDPVPEPATWGLMILGFGAAGAALRRRARRSVAA
jgi:hypothetical protein